LADAMKSTLARLLDTPSARLQLVSSRRTHAVALEAEYRDDTTGERYAVSVESTEASFERVTGS
jgi:hypothetical protein